VLAGRAAEPPCTPATPLRTVREFGTRWAEARWLRDVTPGCKHSHSFRRPGVGIEAFIERALSRRDLIHRHWTEGFQCLGEQIGGRSRALFTETGLRSTGSHALRRIVQLTPRTPRLVSGRVKDVITRSDSKLLSLSDPRIVLNPTVRGSFPLAPRSRRSLRRVSPSRSWRLQDARAVPARRHPAPGCRGPVTGSGSGRVSKSVYR
jgi:hypothetical protein